jgi:anti-anti-sigma regulatory factor
MLRIEIESSAQTTTVHIIGRLRSDDCAGLRQTIEAARPCVILDLREVTLVDAAVIRFLSACENDGVELRHCALYIREWILRERAEGRGP